jgi:hypothetical protein|eukprot:COSAG06_NODE_517_length_14783_cov_54.650027_6_plen_53_part_00
MTMHIQGSYTTTRLLQHNRQQLRTIAIVVATSRGRHRRPARWRGLFPYRAKI